MLQPPPEEYGDGRGASHHLSQFGQWQQLQSDWEQQQQHSHPYYASHSQHYASPHPYDPYSPYPPHPYPPYHTDAPPSPSPPLILRIALTPSQTVDLPIDVNAYPPPDPSELVADFCAQHSIDDESRQQKLHAMVTSHLQQHYDQQAQHPPVTQPHDYYPPHAYPPYDDGMYREEDEEVEATLRPTYAPVRPSSAHSNGRAFTPSPDHSRRPSSSPHPRPTHLPLPLSSSPSTTTSLSPRSLDLLRSHRPQYLSSPASLRLYQHASIRHQQSAQRMAQHLADKEAKDVEELARCTFKPQVRGLDGLPAGVRRRQGRHQFQLIEDWDGTKRQMRLTRLRRAHEKEANEQLIFHPTVNAVSAQLATQGQRKKSAQARPVKGEAKAEPVKPTPAQLKEKRAKIQHFLQRTVEREKSRAAPPPPAVPSFQPCITRRGQEVGKERVGTGAEERKRQRKCEELYKGWADERGMIARERWVRLMKRAMGGEKGVGMRDEFTWDDWGVVRWMVKECDGEVRRVRKERRAEGRLGEDEDLSWQLSAVDFVGWFERLWGRVKEQANTSQQNEQRMVHKFIATADHQLTT